MSTTGARLRAAMDAHRRTVAAVLAVILVANVFLLGHRALLPERTDSAASLVGPDGRPLTGANPSANELAGAGGSLVGGGAPGSIVPSVINLPPGTYIPGKGTVPFGLSGNTIKVAYYWKGDQTKSSPFLKKIGQEGNVDEGDAFRKLIHYINMHADDGEGEIMGFRFNLRGWRLAEEPREPENDKERIVFEAGRGDDVKALAKKLAFDIKPFAAVSSHGSISTIVCPIISQAGIFNVSTYDLDWDLVKRTNGYCMPSGLSFGSQVDLSTRYLKQWGSVPYESGVLSEPRKYGMLYAAYDGLKDSAPKVYDMMVKAGVPFVIKKSVSDDTGTAGRQQPIVIKDFKAAGVNTVVAPDSGSLLTFTHAAQAAGYFPDYYVWPCSGSDSTGMVRLYDSTQWTRASGLTCYDDEFNADLLMDDVGKKSKWYAAYREAARDMGYPKAEPPAPTALVYQSLLPLVAGITRAGPDLTIERYRSGIGAFMPYRYSAVDGKTSNPANILLSINSPDGSQVGDAARVCWDPKVDNGNATPGRYVFPQDHRYRRGQTPSLDPPCPS